MDIPHYNFPGENLVSSGTWGNFCLLNAFLLDEGYARQDSLVIPAVTELMLPPFSEQSSDDSLGLPFSPILNTSFLLCSVSPFSV